jgi:hypothetical protein
MTVRPLLDCTRAVQRVVSASSQIGTLRSPQAPPVGSIIPYDLWPNLARPLFELTNVTPVHIRLVGKRLLRQTPCTAESAQIGNPGAGTVSPAKPILAAGCTRQHPSPRKRREPGSDSENGSGAGVWGVARSWAYRLLNPSSQPRARQPSSLPQRGGDSCLGWSGIPRRVHLSD